MPRGIPGNNIDKTNKLAKKAVREVQKAVEATATPTVKKHPRKNAANNAQRRVKAQSSLWTDPARIKEKNQLIYARKKAKKEGRPVEEVLAELKAKSAGSPNGDARAFNISPTPIAVETLIHPDEMALPSPTPFGEATKPGTWVWDRTRLAAAESMAEGHSIKDTVDSVGIGKTTLYEWMRHPSGEFMKYHDQLVMEMSIANKRLRIARLVRINDQLFDVAQAKFEQLLQQDGKGAALLSEESLKGIVSEIRETATLVAKEKMELVDVVQNNNTNTNMNFELGAGDVANFLGSLGESERERMKERFMNVADAAIQNLKGK